MYVGVVLFIEDKDLIDPNGPKAQCNFKPEAAEVSFHAHMIVYDDRVIGHRSGHIGRIHKLPADMPTPAQIEPKAG